MAYEKSDLHSLVKQAMSLRDTEEFAHLLQESMAEERRKRQEFYDLIHKDIKAEFIDGEIVVHSPVRNEHWAIVQAISDQISPYVRQHRLGRIGTKR